jgi:hypothetical protein
MTQFDFTCSITTNVTAAATMAAISHVQDWWAKDFTGTAEKLNDQFTVRFGDTFVDFKVTEFIPDTKIVWTVTKSFLPWLKDKTEWINTKVIFELSTLNKMTTVHFTHVGLVPQVECYDNCVRGWTQYVPGSLNKLLNEGVGQPN